MKKVITKDGSVTFFNKKYDEWYHSKTGAVEEAFEKYAKPCKLKNGMKILDICFGIGYNSAAALDTVNELRIVALENDSKIIKKILKLDSKFDSYCVIKDVALNGQYDKDGVRVDLVMGDARKSVKELKEKFDVVFLDPFSPKKCPELWTFEFFSDIRKVMKKGGVLATYSCARSVRENLVKAGFRVEDGPCVGRNAPSTLAYA